MSLWTRPVTRDAYDGIDSLSSSASGGVWKRLLVGIGLALAVVAYAIYSIEVGRIYIPGGRHGGYLTGGLVPYAAVSYFGIGAFVHFHYFWGLLTRWHAQSIANVGKGLSCFVILFGIGKCFAIMFAF